MTQAKRTPGPWHTNKENPDGVVYATIKTGPHTAKIIVIARDCSEDDALFIAAATIAEAGGGK